MVDRAPGQIRSRSVRRTDGPRERAEGEAAGALFEKARCGVPAASDELARHYLPDLRRWTRVRMRARHCDPADDDDVLQDTLLGAFDHIESLRSRDVRSFEQYLRTSLDHRVSDAIRRLARQPHLEPLSDAPSGPSWDPFERLAASELWHVYRESLRDFPSRTRWAVALRVEDECSYGEIAGLIGDTSANAVRMRVSRALRRLTGRLARAVPALAARRSRGHRTVRRR